MLKIHKLKWQQCLSHQIWPYIEKGWKDEDRNIHFLQRDMVIELLY